MTTGPLIGPAGKKLLTDSPTQRASSASRSLQRTLVLSNITRIEDASSANGTRCTNASSSSPQPATTKAAKAAFSPWEINTPANSNTPAESNQIAARVMVSALPWGGGI